MQSQATKKPHSAPNQDPNNRGAILVITLLIIAALTALTLAFSEESRVELNLAQFSRETLQARQMAAAGFNLVLNETDKTPEEKKKEFEETKRDWSQFGPLTFPDSLPDGITVQARYWDESGKINLDFFYKKLKENKESEEVKQMKEQLSRLFGALGAEEPAALLDPLIDWLDTDSETSFMGAEDDYYQGLPNPYPCANGPLLTIDQIYLIKGFEDLKLNTENGEKKISDFLTLYGNDAGAVNVNAASKEVIQSLNADIDADAVVTYRQEHGDITDIYAVPDVGVLAGSIKTKIIYKSDAPAYDIEVKVKVQEAETRLKAIEKKSKNPNSGKTNQEIFYWRMN